MTESVSLNNLKLYKDLIMETSTPSQAVEFGDELDSAVNFFEVIRKINLNNEAKIRVVNLLITEEGRIETSTRELVTV